MNAKLDSLIAALQSPALPGIDLSLDRMRQALAALGHPEERLPPVIHVAGTNGKGSTIAYLRAMFEAAGQRVHVYISPPLIRFNERIILGGMEIGDDALILYLQRVADLGRRIPLTSFEAATVAAFLAFADHPADTLLLEVGLGGRLDATNVIAHPKATLLTPISLDHTEFLGSDLGSIAGEKAGILKPNAPAFCAVQSAAALAVIRARAQETHAPLAIEGEDWQVAPAGNGFVLRWKQARYEFPAPALLGEHQLGNAALAAVTALSLGVSPEAVAMGVSNAHWPGRLQLLKRGKLVEHWHGSVYLDGAHNVAAAREIARWARTRGHPVRLIVGMMARKDARGFFRALAGSVAHIACITIPGHTDSATAEELAGAAHDAGMAEAFAANSAADAIRHFPAGAKGDLLVTGSLFLVGEILKDHE